MGLCFLDALWIVSMMPCYVNGRLPERPKPIPWAWGLLNIVSGLYLGATIWYNAPFAFSSPEGHILFIVWFLIAAIIDVVLIDHYGLLKHLG